ncbi:uncharacterized protein V1516DRAFT_616642, partial [Lipomyces oligophaga]|uniref:uncharacterized protein n=1 Tax=Lipomyces oligophaga TaxID=45792 RepID=UPI0034CD3802
AMSRALRHVHISKPGAPIAYTVAQSTQDSLVRAFLDYKLNPSTPPPPPTILTMELAPVYTFGRRQHSSDPDIKSVLNQLSRTAPEAAIVSAQRGGQTTFHGPGQLVAYPILDLRTFSLSSKCYVDALQRAAISFLVNDCHLPQACATENTGVWLDSTHKIASIGVHLRRHITSHGIAINAFTDLSYFEKIVACGLPDAKATSIRDA